MADTIEHLIRQWWADRLPAERDLIADAAADDIVTDDVLALLISTRCPIGPAGVKWEQEPSFAWYWAESVRRIVLEDPELERWWVTLDADTQARLVLAVEAERASPEVVELVDRSGYPGGGPYMGFPQPDQTSAWPTRLRRLLLRQLHDGPTTSTD